MSGTLQAQVILWTTGTDSSYSGAWEEATNWSTNTLPTSGNTARFTPPINAFNLTVSVASQQSVDSLEVLGEYLSFDLAGGGELQIGGTLKLQDTTVVVFNGRVTANAFDVTNSTFALGNSTLKLTQGAQIASRIDGFGTGTLELAGGTTAILQGSQVELGTLRVTGGTTTVNTNSLYFRTQSVDVTGGSLTFQNGPPADLDSISVSGTGTLVINAHPDFPVVSLRGSTVVGPGGTLTGDAIFSMLSSSLVVDRGTLAGTGSVGAYDSLITVIASDATINRDIFLGGGGAMRINVADVLYSPLHGAATITTESYGHLRILDQPIVGTSGNPNGIFASNLNITNQYIMSVGSLTPVSGNQAFTYFSLGGVFNNSGTLTLTNNSTMLALGGGTSTGAFALGTGDTNLVFSGGHTITDNGSKFSGSGRVHFDGGTILTSGGTYTPNYKMALVGAAPSLPGVTELAISGSLWIGGTLPNIPLNLLAGSETVWSHGVAANTITVNSGATLGFSGPASFLMEQLGVNARPNADIENHGTIRMLGSYDGAPVQGSGIIRNRSDGLLTNLSFTGVRAGLARFALEMLNEGNMDFEVRDNGVLELGPISNQGTAAFRAIESVMDANDDVKIQVGDYSQSAGNTTIQATWWNAGSTPEPVVEFGNLINAGGTITASGTVRALSVSNASLFNLTSGRLNVSGSFTNQIGGDLRLNGRLSTGGAFTMQSGSRLLLDGWDSDVWVGGSPIFNGPFTVPSGVVIEIRNRSTASNQTLTTDGTLIVGSGTVMTQWGGNLTGSGQIRVGSGGTLWLGGGGNFSDPLPITVEAGGLAQFEGQQNDINRFYGRPLVNYGTVEHNASHVGMNAATLFTNYGLWIERSGKSYTVSDGQAPGGVFQNYGTFRKTGNNTATFATTTVFNNSGTIDVQEGTLEVFGSGNFAGTSIVNANGGHFALHQGEVTVADGARFNGSIGFGPGGTRTMNGNVTGENVAFWGGTLTGDHTLHGIWTMSNGASLWNAGTTRIAADGTWIFAGHENNINRLYGHTFINNGTVNRNASHLGFSTSTSVTNNGTWTDVGNVTYNGGDGQPAGGSFVNNGLFLKQGASQLSFEFYGPLFTNNGTVDVASGGTLFFNVGRISNRVGNALVGGTWIFRDGSYMLDSEGTLTTLNADVTHYGNGGFLNGALNRNEGIFRIMGNANDNFGATFTNTGTLSIEAGSQFHSTSLTNSGLLVNNGIVHAGFTNTGSISGSGSFVGNIFSAGQLSPGNSPGLLTVTGDLTLQSTSALLMELGGTSEGVTYDSIDVSGALTFGGSLDVVLVNTFSPVTGSSFNLFDANSFAGTFATVNLPSLTTGLTWDTSGLYSTGILSVVGTAVPEPSTWAALLGLAALGAACARRHRGPGV